LEQLDGSISLRLVTMGIELEILLAEPLLEPFGH
jgi:hypothetical protein